MRREVAVEGITATLLELLDLAILVVCRATGGYDSDEELSLSNASLVVRRDVLLVSSEKIAETTSEAKSATEEMS